MSPEMRFWRTAVFLLIIGEIYGARAAAAGSCSKDEPKRCASKADNLVKDPDLAFPDNAASVNRVCGTWNTFRDCFMNYTKNCLSAREQMEFQRTFQGPVSSMRTLCEDSAFRKEYLMYAPCIKKVSTDNRNCGRQYRFLIGYMSGATAEVKVTDLCCARDKFKRCVELRTREQCDSRPSAGNDLVELNATAYAIKALDKSLAYVTQQCSSSSFKPEDCQGMEVNDVTSSDPGQQQVAAGSHEVTKTAKPHPTIPTTLAPAKPRRATTQKLVQKEAPKNSGFSIFGTKPVLGLLLLFIFHVGRMDII